MKKSTSGQYAMVCRRFLAPLGHPEGIDIRDLDIDDVVRGFHDSSTGLQESTQEMYEKTFRRAVSSFLEYVDDPASWSPPNRSRASADRPPSRTPAQPRRQPPLDTQDKSPHITIPIHLPTGRNAQLVIPPELTEVEAELLANVVSVYVQGHIHRAAT
ncbi:hypothetical protein [Streptomyces sp. NPDC050416]|uniref:hypothetical protein n=1 Tax=Streptomyces sp. NPDC050416 TaxID=3365611 RepID=UPI0037B35D54